METETTTRRSALLDLLRAIENGDVEKARCLVQDPDINLTRKVRQSNGQGCISILCYAMLYGEQEIALCLLDAGADPNISSWVSRLGWQNSLVLPLSLACEQGNEAMVQKLLAAGADLELAKFKVTQWVSEEEGGSMSCSDKNSFLHKGIIDSWSLHMLQMIINHGANVIAKNDSEETPLDIAATKSIWPQPAISYLCLLLMEGAEHSHNWHICLLEELKDAFIDVSNFSSLPDFNQLMTLIMSLDYKRDTKNVFSEFVSRHRNVLNSDFIKHCQTWQMSNLTLKELCRHQIRALIGPRKLSKKIEILDLPKNLKDYLCLRM